VNPPTDSVRPSYEAVRCGPLLTKAFQAHITLKMRKAAVGPHR